MKDELLRLIYFYEPTCNPNLTWCVETAKLYLKLSLCFWQITRFVLKRVFRFAICYNTILLWFCILFLQFLFVVGNEIRYYKMQLFSGSQRKGFKFICFRKKFARTDKVSKSGFRVTSNFPLHVYKISILTDKAHSDITIIDQFQKCDKNKSILNQRILHFQFSVCPQVSEFTCTCVCVSQQHSLVSILHTCTFMLK